MPDFRIIYSTPDGGVAVITPAPECGLTIEEIAAKDVPAGTPYEIIDAAAQPDRTFRNAWVRNGKAIGHDMPKAKAITHDKRRLSRAAEFAPLDLEATIPAKAAQAEAKRAAVRAKYDAIQVTIDAANTVAELKTIMESLNA